MRIAVIGDIHANIDAFTATLDAIDASAADRIVSTGDITGYGGAPRECIALLRTRGIPTVMGNHDEYVTQLGGTWRIQADAQAAIHWTQLALRPEEIRWLGGLPRLLDVQGFHMLHASHAWWPRWPYVINRRTAMQNFLFQPGRIAFNGHSHLPLLVTHLPGAMPVIQPLHDEMRLPEDRQTLIAVGSVGQPRDGDPRACFVMLDTAAQTVQVRRVAYDIARAQRRIIQAGLPEDLAVRLDEGR